MGQVSLRGVRKRFGATEVVAGVDLEILDGEFLVLVGPSGCGKSTLLRLIAGLEEATSGELRIDGRLVNDVHPAQRGAAMVFQSYALYPHMTVAENLGFALRMAGVPRAEREARVGEVAHTLQLQELLSRFPKELSGGQRQRVAIGRAIVRQPTVFLFDEPLSNLDAALRMSMRIELTRLHRELATTMVYVTHDQVEAMTMGDRIAVLNGGRIEQVGRPLDLYREPGNLFVASFLGTPRINIVPCPGSSAPEAHRALWASATSGRWQASLRIHCVGIRPEHLHIRPATQAEGLEAIVVLAEHLGDASIVHLQVEGVAELLQARVPLRGEELAPGQRVRLVPEAGRVLAFDAAGSRLPE
jgi:multiple sugar transport system ATP-binding protein